MNFIEVWYQALNSETGICIEVTNFASVKQQLYQARKNLNDPALAGISIHRSPVNPDHMWLVKAPTKEKAEISI